MTQRYTFGMSYEQHGLRKYLRVATNKQELQNRLIKTLGKAVQNGLKLCDPHVCRPDTSIQKALENCNGLPMLVKSDDPDQLLGILTSFDLL